MQIYTSCLESYINGALHGQWIDITKPIDDVFKDIHNMLKASPMPNSQEWAIHDYDGFNDIRLGEYESLEHIQKIAVFIKEHGNLATQLLLELDNDVDAAQSMIENNYLGEYESVVDYAKESIESSGDVPNHLKHYIDYDLMAKDMLNDLFTFETDDGSIHIFSWS